MTKVKGYAKAEHIERGEATVATKEGNDWADHYATKGIKQHQEVAVKTAKWLKGRQEDYAKLMGRIQNVSVAVLKSEKEERKRRRVLPTALKGYDDTK